LWTFEGEQLAYSFSLASSGLQANLAQRDW
jgi:hypothetical protein